MSSFFEDMDNIIIEFFQAAETTILNLKEKEKDEESSDDER